MAKKKKSDAFGDVFKGVMSDSSKRQNEVKEESTPKKKIKTIPITFKIEEDLLFSIRALAFWNKEKQQDIINSSIRKHLAEMPQEEREKAEEEYQKYIDR